MQSNLVDLVPEIAAPPPLAKPAAAARRALETLHPSLWLGHQLGRQVDAIVASGYPALDAELPGGGWPRKSLIVLPHPGVGEIRLVAPALTRAQKRVVMLFDPPMQLDAAVLIDLGFDLDLLYVIKTRTRTLPGADSLWSLEQALKGGHVGAVLAWLPPRLRAERIRRLQLAAHNLDGLAFVVGEARVADRPSASPLRLALRAGGVDRIRIDVVKRRGPPLFAPMLIDLPSALSATAKRRSRLASSAAEVVDKAMSMS